MIKRLITLEMNKITRDKFHTINSRLFLITHHTSNKIPLNSCGVRGKEKLVIY